MRQSHSSGALCGLGHCHHVKGPGGHRGQPVPRPRHSPAAGSLPRQNRNAAGHQKSAGRSINQRLQRPLTEESAGGLFSYQADRWAPTGFRKHGDCRGGYQPSANLHLFTVNGRAMRAPMENRGLTSGNGRTHRCAPTKLQPTGGSGNKGADFAFDCPLVKDGCPVFL